MTFDELEQQVKEYIYTEDQGMAMVATASIISTRLKLGDPLWVIIIGPSSSGKSQILRPLALTDEKFIHRIDDLTENTFLSGSQAGKGKKEISLLKRIGSLGIIVISDMTVIFSKGAEAKNAILSQFRMIYDGEMNKSSGNNPEPIKWKGSLGILAGSTPSIYAHFEEIADMGERFIYYRMKDYDVEKATRLSLKRKIFGRELDEKLSSMYEEYIKDVVKTVQDIQIPELDEEVDNRVVNIAMFAALLRTPTHYNPYIRAIDKIPVSEAPMRIALELLSLTKALMAIQYHDTGSFTLDEDKIGYIEWCAYSLANEERRACLRILASIEYDVYIKSQTIADTIGLNTQIVSISLQHLSAIGILARFGTEGSLQWKIKDKKVWDLIRRLEDMNVVMSVEDERGMTSEEIEESNYEGNIDKF